MAQMAGTTGHERGPFWVLRWDAGQQGKHFGAKLCLVLTHLLSSGHRYMALFAGVRLLWLYATMEGRTLVPRGHRGIAPQRFEAETEPRSLMLPGGSGTTASTGVGGIRRNNQSWETS